jgi:hypothetical protein
MKLYSLFQQLKVNLIIPSYSQIIIRGIFILVLALTCKGKLHS